MKALLYFKFKYRVKFVLVMCFTNRTKLIYINASLKVILQFNFNIYNFIFLYF